MGALTIKGPDRGLDGK